MTAGSGRPICSQTAAIPWAPTCRQGMGSQYGSHFLDTAGRGQTNSLQPSPGHTLQAKGWPSEFSICSKQKGRPKPPDCCVKELPQQLPSVA